MQLYLRNLHRPLRNGRLIALFTIIICIFLFTANGELNTDPNGRISDHSGSVSDVNNADGNNVTTDTNGPTMILSYNYLKNPIESFTYFIPLISPTLVHNISSVNNTQHVGVLSHKIKVGSKSFRAACEFEIVGSGFHMNTFDPAGMIAEHIDEYKEGQTMTKLLDYIKLEGNGHGLFVVKGRISSSTRTVTEVEIKFNVRGHRSPVTAGLYDVKPINGQYKYANRSNEIVARVNVLSFKKTEETPRIGIKVASIAKRDRPTDSFKGVKGRIANMFIKPPKVDKLGNTTMLKFGQAVFEKKPEFTFPKAKNIKGNKVVEIDALQK